MSEQQGKQGGLQRSASAELGTRAMKLGTRTSELGAHAAGLGRAHSSTCFPLAALPPENTPLFQVDRNLDGHSQHAFLDPASSASPGS